MVHYLAHIFRVNPSREDCFVVMEQLLRDKVKDADRLVYFMDANSRMARLQRPVTGRFSAHEFSDEGGKRLIEICRTAGLCAASTFFASSGKGGTAVTYIPRDASETNAELGIDLKERGFGQRHRRGFASHTVLHHHERAHNQLVHFCSTRPSSVMVNSAWKHHGVEEHLLLVKLAVFGNKSFVHNV